MAVVVSYLRVLGAVLVRPSSRPSGRGWIAMVCTAGIIGGGGHGVVAIVVAVAPVTGDDFLKISSLNKDRLR